MSVKQTNKLRINKLYLVAITGEHIDGERVYQLIPKCAKQVKQLTMMLEYGAEIVPRIETIELKEFAREKDTISDIYFSDFLNVEMFYVYRAEFEARANKDKLFYKQSQNKPKKAVSVKKRTQPKAVGYDKPVIELNNESYELRKQTNKVLRIIALLIGLDIALNVYHLLVNLI
jgi:hypothetical protein